MLSRNASSTPLKRDIYVSHYYIVQDTQPRTEMGALAFQEQVENLAAATRSQGFEMPRSGEVLTLELVAIVRKIDRLIDRIWRIRALYITIVREMPSAEHALAQIKNDEDRSASIAALRQLVENTSRPALTDDEGDDAADVLHGLAAFYSKKSVDDGRFVRRRAKRLREAGEACDVQRLKVLAKAQELLNLAANLSANELTIRTSEKDKYDDLISAHLAKYPIAMDYLAR